MDALVRAGKVNSQWKLCRAIKVLAFRLVASAGAQILARGSDAAAAVTAVAAMHIFARIRFREVHRCVADRSEGSGGAEGRAIG